MLYLSGHEAINMASFWLLLYRVPNPKLNAIPQTVNPQPPQHKVEGSGELFFDEDIPRSFAAGTAMLLGL